MTVPEGSWTEANIAKANACLDKLLATPIFAQAERQQRFLRYIVSETLAGRADKLKGYAIGVEVFDREQSFDPMIDSIVRVEAARLRAKLREYYDGAGRADPLWFELPKGNYAVRILWQETDAAVSGGASAAPDPGISGLRPRPIEDRPSLAVLPFINMSSNPEQEYFADGFTDCLITEVSRLSGLFVISRQSSFIYKGMVKRAEDIGLELGVKYLLEGSVQRSGECVRITAQLIDAVSGAHVWAERYDRELKDIFALQDDVTRQIATVLRVKLAGNEEARIGHGGTPIVAAHDALLHGLECFWPYTPESVEAARLHFTQAVELDPGYAAAHAWLARALACQWIFLWDARDEVLQQAYAAARSAVDLDPQLPLAHSVLSWVQCWRQQGESSLDAGQRAVTLDPNNADGYLFLAMTLVAAGEGEAALRHIETGMRLNPHPSTFYQLALGFCHLVLEQYEMAMAAFRRGTELTEAFLPNHVWLCVTYTLLEREDEARVERETVLRLAAGRRPVVQTLWREPPLRVLMNGRMQRAGLA